MDKNYTVWVGIDWADRKHAYALRVLGSEKVRSGTFLQKADAISEWVSGLRRLASGGKIAIALEQSKGGLIFALRKYDFIHLYPLNPDSVAKYRASLAPSGSKSDPVDAALILELLEQRYKKLKTWEPEPDEMRLLERLTEQRAHLMHDLKRVGNKLTSALKEYYPEVLEMFSKIHRPIVGEFLLAYPTLKTAQEASIQELLSFFRKHSNGSTKCAARRIDLVKGATPLIEDSVIIQANTLLVQALAQQIKAMNLSLKTYDQKIEAVYSTIPDHEIFDSLPQAGEVSAPRLLAAMGTNRQRFESAIELANFAGISPVVEESGTQSWTHWRFRCNKIVRQSFVEWTFLTLRASFWAEELYKKLKARGKTHSVAVRAIAFKWIRIIFRMWKDKTPYSEARYLKALQKSGSPLMGGVQQKAAG